MAEYKEIHGTKIRNYTTNPDNPITGEVWYNDTDNVLKFQYPNTTTAGSWRTTYSVNTPRRDLAGGGAGTPTAAIIFGGYTASPLPAAIVALTESFNGSAWTEVNDLNTAVQESAGSGTATAALSFGGSSPTTGNTETWNGTNWTEVNDLNTAREGTWREQEQHQIRLH